MVQSAMQRMFMALLEQAKENGALRDLLVDDGREDERPRIQVGGAKYMLGLIDGQPMLVKESDKSFLHPTMVGGELKEIVWRLRP